MIPFRERRRRVIKFQNAAAVWLMAAPLWHFGDKLVDDWKKMLMLFTKMIHLNVNSWQFKRGEKLNLLKTEYKRLCRTTAATFT